MVFTFLLVLVFVFSSMFAAMGGFYLNHIANQQFEESVNAAGTIEYLTILLKDIMNNSRVRDLYNTTLASWSSIVGADITVIDSNGEVFASTTNIKTTPPDMTKRVLSGETLKKYTAVSEETAREMALGALCACPKANCAASVTGIAGPGGAVPGKPVGTVCFGFAFRAEGTAQPTVKTATEHFAGGRSEVRMQSILRALDGLIEASAQRKNFSL